MPIFEKNKKTDKKNTPKRRTVFVGLISREEKDQFIENLSMLLASGMDILLALQSIKEEVRSSGMRRIIGYMEEDVLTGIPLGEVLQKSKLFPDFVVSLVKIGERSGSLVKNLKAVALQQKKNRSFSAKIRSAMVYPVFVLGLTILVGVGIAWFILPKLVTVFDQMKVTLPLITQLLIAFGKFIGLYGNVAIPVFLGVVFGLLYFIFSFSKAKFIGQAILFALPGIKRLIRETELARMGYILGTLLSAGLPIVEAIRSLGEATTFFAYKKFYRFLEENIMDGNSFQQSFKKYKKSKKYIPFTVQQMIIVGERSGRLPETLLSVGETYEEKIENTTKNISALLEPVLLVVVWLGVVSVALAVILPIYSLIGGFSVSEQMSRPTTPAFVVTETVGVDSGQSDISVETPGGNVATSEIKQSIMVLPTPGDKVNVRTSSDIQSKKIGTVRSGEAYVFTDKQNGWYSIVLSDGSTGWVNEVYVSESKK